MLTQAEALARPLNSTVPCPLRVAVTSGKGGVGKTSIVANAAELLAAGGLRVLVIDADYGLANLAVGLGVAPERNLGDVMEGRCQLEDALIEVRKDLDLLPASSGGRRLGALSETSTLALLNRVEDFTRGYGLVLLDTAAGIGPAVLATLAWADRAVIAVSQDPMSFVDAYALAKLVLEAGGTPVSLLINQAIDARHGQALHENFARVSERFLGRSPEPLGIVPQDPLLAAAVRAQRLVVNNSPDAPSSRALNAFARWLEGLVEDHRTRLKA